MMDSINGGENMYNIAVCEDDKVQAKQLVHILKKYETAHSIGLVVDVFYSAESMLKASIIKYDLIFLDIGLPGLSGIELAKKIRETSSRVKLVFLTAHEQLWPEGYKVSATRFLVKPLNENHLFQELASLLSDGVEERQCILASKDRVLAKVFIDEILYLEISGRKVLIHTFDNVYSSSHSLSYWVKTLANQSFVQTHSSYLVNLKYVKFVGRDSVTLVTGDKVYVSLRRYKHFKDSFMRYVSQI